MKVLDHFSIPFKGLGNGVHEMNFLVDNEFFSAIEGAGIDNGKFDVLVTLTKQFDHTVLQFDIDGHTQTSCDRCTADINLPVNGQYELYVKFGDEKLSTDEILFIHPETSILNVAQLVYEYILLSLPIIKTYDCDADAPVPCNQVVLDKLSVSDDLEDDEQEESGSSIWNSLKDLNLDD